MKIVFYRLRVACYFAWLFVLIRYFRIVSPQKTFIGISMDGDYGDIIASEPILSALKEKFGEVDITWIASSQYQPLLEFHPLVNRFIDLKFTLLSHFLIQSNPFHHHYSLHLSGFRKDSTTDTVIVNPRADALGISLSNYYLNYNLLEVASQLADVGLLKGQPHLYVDQEEIELPFLTPYWVIHCKSNMGWRDWTDEKWVKLLDLIIQKWGVHILEIGRVHPLPYQHPNYKSVVGKTSVMTMMKLIKNAQFFIGLDSGPTHMANAFEIPGLVLCGEFSHFKTYMPYSGFYQDQEKTKVLFNTKGAANGLSLEEVWAEVQRLYELSYS